MHLYVYACNMKFFLFLDQYIEAIYLENKKSSYVQFMNFE